MGSGCCGREGKRKVVEESFREWVGSIVNSERRSISGILDIRVYLLYPTNFMETSTFKNTSTATKTSASPTKLKPA